MLAEALTALATAGGSALVGAMATDAWQAAKAGFSQLLGRGDAGRVAAVERQLEASQAQLEAAEGRDEQVRLMQQAVWTARLEDLLIEQPEAAEHLRFLIERIDQAASTRTAGHVSQTVLGLDQAQQAVQGHGTQNNFFGYRKHGAGGGA